MLFVFENEQAVCFVVRTGCLPQYTLFDLSDFGSTSYLHAIVSLKIHKRALC